MSFLAPLFLAGLAAIAVPIWVHLIQRERKDILEFPSLMFIQETPYQSTERRRVHNWPLLLLRAAAIALLIAAFSRPFLTQDAVSAAAALDGAREVVILLDRSASMGYGDHFARAQDEARTVVEGLGSLDQATLVLFGDKVEETVRATSDRNQLRIAIDNATVTSEATRYGQPLRFAQSVLSRSALPRMEAVLISDFQRSGWEQREDVRLPEGATLTPISVADAESTNLSLTSVAFEREMFSGEERVMITAGLVNRGAADVTNQPVQLEVGGQVVDTRPVTIGPNSAASVTFPALTVSEAFVRARIRAGTDDLAADNEFYFVLSPSRPLSVLIVQPDGAATRGGQSPSVYLTTALEAWANPSFAADVVSIARLTPASLQGRSVVVLNNVSALSSPVDNALNEFVEQGGGVFVALADRSPWRGASPLLPGAVGQMVDRRGTRGTVGFLDFSHPVLEPFKDPRNGTFAGARFLRYARLNPEPEDQVLMRFDDGAVALVERQVGSGHVMAWTSTLDTGWNDFPTKALYPVVIPSAISYLAQYEEAESWYTVGRMMDVSLPLASLLRQGEGGAVDTARSASGVVVSPSGSQIAMGDGGSPTVELGEQGFYSVRMQGADGRPFTVAVNLDPTESDLTPLAPEQFVAEATGQAAVTMAGESLERPDFTPAEIEKRQGLWWFLLVLGVAALLAESVLSNRMSSQTKPQPSETAG